MTPLRPLAMVPYRERLKVKVAARLPKIGGVGSVSKLENPRIPFSGEVSRTSEYCLLAVEVEYSRVTVRPSDEFELGVQVALRGVPFEGLFL